MEIFIIRRRVRASILRRVVYYFSIRKRNEISRKCFHALLPFPKLRVCVTDYVAKWFEENWVVFNFPQYKQLLTERHLTQINPRRSL